MAYYINLSEITLDQYKEKLKSAYLPPSRNMLRERGNERFGFFKKKGINNVLELKQFLSNKENISECSGMEYFGNDYLVILLREIKSNLPKPNKLSEFPGISTETAKRLEKIGIKNTVKLYDRILTPQSRKELAKETGISDKEILELTKLTDISRIRWVGTTFARMLYDLGIDTIKQAAEADADDLHARINKLNNEQGIFKGHVGLNDVKILIDVAGDVPQEIVY